MEKIQIKFEKSNSNINFAFIQTAEKCGPEKL